MKQNFPNLGIDGCPAGWISIQAGEQFGWTIELFHTIQDLWDIHSNSNLILIDIPIGLKDDGGIPRLNDSAARKYLTSKRSSCIFPTPCRKALYSSNYKEANDINKELTGKGLSKQSWNICPKIREMDKFLQKNYKAREVFIESGPELSYSILNNNKPMDYYKKTREGMRERLSILKSYSKSNFNPLDIGLKKYKRKDVSKDDIMDAWILAIRASGGKSNLHIIPENIEYDSTGLPMRIAF
jgi:predicted RNase H-like nuclease